MKLFGLISISLVSATPAGRNWQNQKLSRGFSYFSPGKQALVPEVQIDNADYRPLVEAAWKPLLPEKCLDPFLFVFLLNKYGDFDATDNNNPGSLFDTNNG